MKKLTLIFLTAISFVACKKNTPAPQPAPYVATISPLADTTKLFYAKLQAITIQNIYILPTSVSNTYSASAYFAGSLQQLNAWYNYGNVSLIKLNNVALNFANYTNYESILYANDSTANWHVIGKDNIPTFDFTNSGRMPSYNYLLVPDSLDHTQDFTLPVNPARTQTFEVYLKEQASSHMYDTVFTLTSNQTSVTIPAAKLHYFASDYYQLIITQSNYNPQSVNGLPMCFISQYQTKKEIFVK